MPKLVDYAARFAFVREAAFTIVRDRGVGHLSRRAVAAELGLSLASVRRILDPAAPLELLAAAEVAARRDAARWQSSVRASDLDRPREQVAARLAQALLPDPVQLAAEVVWLRLLLAAPHVTRRARCHTDPDEGGDPPLSLRERRQVADGCWSPEEQGAPMTEDQPDPMAVPAADHREQQSHTIRSVLDRVGIDDSTREHDADTVLALVTGLVLEICLGHRDPAEARGLLQRHLVGLLPAPR